MKTHKEDDIDQFPPTGKMIRRLHVKMVMEQYAEIYSKPYRDLLEAIAKESGCLDGQHGVAPLRELLSNARKLLNQGE